MTIIKKPLAGKILIEPKKAEEKTVSGIYLPESAQEKPQTGKVIAVGSDKVDEKMEIKVDDTVLYGKYSGTEVKLNEKNYLVLSQSDVLLIL